MTPTVTRFVPRLILLCAVVFSFRPMAAQNELQKICQPLLLPAPPPLLVTLPVCLPARLPGRREGTPSKKVSAAVWRNQILQGGDRPPRLPPPHLPPPRSTL